MTRTKDRGGRIQLFFIALVFFGPLIVATWLYFSGKGFRPEGKTNHGELLQPLVNIGDALPDASIIARGGGQWLLVYAQDGVCSDACEFSLYTLRQSRLMLGKEMDRLARVFLHGESAPDTVFLTNEHTGLITLRDRDLGELLDSLRPVEVAAGGYYLVDPLGNVVLYFRPDIEPSHMVEDIKRLLKLSSIG